ncbi:MAG: alpha/beta fold hydrolase, partial [Bacteriovoracaceae bacterium]
MNVVKANYFKTEDGEQVFYSTNFDPAKDGASHEDVLVFNYGLVCSNHHWSKQLKHFDDRGYKILTHDYRGHYLSTGHNDVANITFQNITDDLHKICVALNIKSSIQIGHSMGVNICLEFARRYPEMTKRMVLISGTVIPVFNIMFNSNITDQTLPSAAKLMKKFPKLFESFWKYGGWNPVTRKMINVFESKSGRY